MNMNMDSAPVFDARGECHLSVFELEEHQTGVGKPHYRNIIRTITREPFQNVPSQMWTAKVSEVTIDSNGPYVLAGCTNYKFIYLYNLTVKERGPVKKRLEPIYQCSFKSEILSFTYNKIKKRGVASCIDGKLHIFNIVKENQQPKITLSKTIDKSSFEPSAGLGPKGETRWKAYSLLLTSKDILLIGNRDTNNVLAFAISEKAAPRALGAVLQNTTAWSMCSDRNYEKAFIWVSNRSQLEEYSLEEIEHSGN